MCYVLKEISTVPDLDSSVVRTGSKKMSLEKGDTIDTIIVSPAHYVARFARRRMNTRVKYLYHFVRVNSINRIVYGTELHVKYGLAGVRRFLILTDGESRFEVAISLCPSSVYILNILGEVGLSTAEGLIDGGKALKVFLSFAVHTYERDISRVWLATRM